jgi:N-acylneuraminate cytidylyltransferase
MRKKPSIIALIPARSGSQRIKDKNIKLLNGHPLVVYSISSAIKSKIFTRIIVSTDDRHYTDIARYYGADVPFLRPKRFSTDYSADIEWVKFTLEKLKKKCAVEDYFSILRPTSPFRTAETIKRAWEEFLEDGKADSLRAIEKCREHPAKMWLVDKDKNRMHPVMVNPKKRDIPWHSNQYPNLPTVYKQNASLEITRTSLPLENNSISGQNIMPFFTRGFEGFDINDEKDWIYAEYLLAQKKVKLPEIIIKSFLK